MIRTAILLTFGFFVFILTIRSLRAQRLKESYVLLFFFTGLPFFILALWPDGILFLSHLLSIEKATLLVLMAAIYFLLTTFSLLSIVSVQERQITAITQLLAIQSHTQDAAKSSQPSEPFQS